MIHACVDFSKKIRLWDGFGISIGTEPCDSHEHVPAILNRELKHLSDDNQHAIVELLFGKDGLHIAIVKIILHPSIQDTIETRYDEGDPMIISEDHFTSFYKSTGLLCQKSVKITASWGGEIKLLCTFSNPPPWMIIHNKNGTKELDPAYRVNFARYMVSWVKQLLLNKLPVSWISIHKNGESWEDVKNNMFNINNDCISIYWSPELMVDIIKKLRHMLDINDLLHVKLSTGETRNLFRFAHWGYAFQLTEDPVAIDSLDLITSDALNETHAVENFMVNCSSGIDDVRQKKTDLHAWITCIEDEKIDAISLVKITNYIYYCKLNSIIWGNALGSSFSIRNSIISINVDDSWELSDSYYYLKLICRAGMPGMALCQVIANITGVSFIGFSCNNTKSQDSFMVINATDKTIDIPIEIRGSVSQLFNLYRTSPAEKYAALGTVYVKEGRINYRVLPFSATAFYGQV
jgi:hypothetical protein